MTRRKATRRVTIREVLRATGLDPVRCRSCGRANDINELTTRLFTEIARRVMAGEDVLVPGFGVFAAKTVAARTMRSGLNDQTYLIPESATIRLYPAKGVRRIMNPDAETIPVDEAAAKNTTLKQTKKREAADDD